MARTAYYTGVAAMIFASAALGQDSIFAPSDGDTQIGPTDEPAVPPEGGPVFAPADEPAVGESDAFGALDANGDGVLDSGELAQQPGLGGQLGAFDQNGDGIIDSGEFGAFETTPGTVPPGTSGDIFNPPPGVGGGVTNPPPGISDGLSNPPPGVGPLINPPPGIPGTP